MPKKELPKVTSLILNWNGLRSTERCVKNLLKQTYENHSIVIVDNGSTDGSQSFFGTKFPEIKLIENNENLGYSKGFNVGIDYAMEEKSDFVLLINNDAVISPNSILEMVKVASLEDSIGFVSGKVFSNLSSRKLETVGRTKSNFTFLGSHIGAGQIDIGNYDEIIEREFIDDIFILVKKEVIDKVGAYDTDFFLYFEEADWQFRAKRLGFKIFYTHRAIAWHEKSTSSGGKTNPVNTYWNSRNIYLFMGKNASESQILFFLLYQFFYNNIIYSLARISKGQLGLLKSFWQGQFTGLKWFIGNSEKRGRQSKLDLLRAKKPIYSKSKINFWINKIVKRNRILRRFLISKYESSIWWGLAVFTTREKSVELSLTDDICRLIKEKGFEIIDLKILDKNEKIVISEKTRGGNWESTLNDQGGNLGSGLPDSIIVAFDSNPARVTDKVDANAWPEIDNKRIVKKTYIRAEINALLDKKLTSNYLHATDNSFQAWNYINLLSPEFQNSVHQKLLKEYLICPICGPGRTLYYASKVYYCKNCNYKKGN